MAFSTVSLYKDVAQTIPPVYSLHKMQLFVYMSKLVHNIGSHTIELQQNQHHFNAKHGSEIRVSGCRLKLTK